jgi:hypothetical protein
MAEDEEKIINVSNSVMNITTDALAAKFETIMNPTGQWKGEHAEPLRFMCRMLANAAIDYFAEQAQGGERLQ